ncbi:MAG: Nramp family divalent metal transporter [Bacteroidetes bacterium]|nr:Nramp family divalent metal transporter [Bacteroidota bacterium]
MKTTEKSASLSEVNASVNTQSKIGFWKKLFAFLGPAYLVSVGYMDPGNWATDIAGGSSFGYSLIWVLLMSNLMALLLQSLSARLGIVSGRDLAQASRESYPPLVNFCLYILAEIAIAACDLAEVLGMAIGLQLLFHLPLLWGVCLSVLDTFLLLFLINYGIRKIEAFIIVLVLIIGASFFMEMIFAQPDMGELAKGFIPTLPSDTALYIAIGIIGATVMPHNLYLHSSLVQTRKFERTKVAIKKAIRFNVIDSTIALNLAFFVNAAILILAASTFYKNGMFNVAEIQDAHRFLEPMLGNKWAPILFAVALIAAGQSSTITGTLAGQIVMEGYLNLRLQPWIRRLITRLIAIVPAFLTITYLGESSTGKLLILSQVILSLQLGFAVIPLIHFVSDKSKMGTFSINTLTKIAAWTAAAIIVSLNVKLVIGEVNEALQLPAFQNIFLKLLLILLLLGVALLLIYVIVNPFVNKAKRTEIKHFHGNLKSLTDSKIPVYAKIAVTVDFSDTDSLTINHALAQGGKNAEYTLIHIVETAGALLMGNEIEDMESSTDKDYLSIYKKHLTEKGFNVVTQLGFGNPKHAIPEIVNIKEADLLVMGAHGHTGMKDILFGTTVDAVRHRIKIPVFIVRN